MKCYVYGRCLFIGFFLTKIHLKWIYSYVHVYMKPLNWSWLWQRKDYLLKDLASQCETKADHLGLPTLPRSFIRWSKNLGRKVVPFFIIHTNHQLKKRGRGDKKVPNNQKWQTFSGFQKYTRNHPGV